MNVKAMVESAMIAALTVIFGLLVMYVPVISLFYIFLPVPIAICGYRNGLRYSIITLIVSSLIISMLSTPVSLIITVTMGIIGVSIGYVMKKDMKISLSLMYVFFITLIAIVLSLYIASFVMGVNIVKDTVNTVKQSMNMNISIYKSMGMSSQNINQIKLLVNELQYLANQLLPYLIILSAFVLVFINYKVTYVILYRLGNKNIRNIPNFSEWRLPSSINLIFIVALISTIALSKSYANTALYQVLNNINFLCYTAFLMIGLSVVAYFLKKRNFNKILKFFIFVTLIIVPIFSYLLILLGLLDTGMNLRHLKISG